MYVTICQVVAWRMQHGDHNFYRRGTTTRVVCRTWRKKLTTTTDLFIITNHVKVARMNMHKVFRILAGCVTFEYEVLLNVTTSLSTIVLQMGWLAGEFVPSATTLTFSFSQDARSRPCSPNFTGSWFLIKSLMKTWTSSTGVILRCLIWK